MNTMSHCMSHCMLPVISGLKICGVDCVLSAEWKSPSKIIARTGPGKGKGDVVVITRSGGVGSCTVGFRGYFVQTGESELGSDIVKRYRYLYCTAKNPFSFKYHIVLFHSLKVLLMILTIVKLSFIKDHPGS